MSMVIDDKLVVIMHYTLTDDSGNTIDSSQEGEPLGYLHGAGNIIPGLEKALAGKAVGDQAQVTLLPEEGYGAVVPELIQTVDRAMFQGVDHIEAGMKFQAQTPDGHTQTLVVKAVEGDNITVDGNHPLAGVVLNFDVEITDIREATEEEIAHGHVH